MSFLTITIRRIEVIGEIWMPCGICAMVYDLKPHDVEDIKALGNGEFSRDACHHWLSTHAGDFQFIQDFHADIEDFDSPWDQEESEFTFNDCMYPEE